MGKNDMPKNGRSAHMINSDRMLILKFDSFSRLEELSNFRINIDAANKQSSDR
jgi:hypothetical protein